MKRRHSVACRVGRRGITLLLIGVLDIIMAISYLFPNPVPRRTPSNTFLNDVAPLSVWGVLWAAVAVVVIASAFRADDRWGFVIATVLKAFWALLHMGAAVIDHVDRAYVSTGIWLAMGGLVWLISTWPEAAWPCCLPDPAEGGD